ncbi:hypothetical protein M426DRAFT_264011 [Hypoxylon sp. CI-4A]|nr:hypothetical protein M426DRAFT_264011 [Hypoxylon sp. CI-4A]
MCHQTYRSYELCPCEIAHKRHPCAQGPLSSHCPGVTASTYRTTELYCEYHTRANDRAHRVRQSYFAERGRRLWAIPRDPTYPVLGRRIGGSSLRTGMAADPDAFPFPFPLPRWRAAGQQPHGATRRRWTPPSRPDCELWDEPAWDWDDRAQVREFQTCKAYYRKQTWFGRKYWELPEPRCPEQPVLVESCKEEEWVDCDDDDKEEEKMEEDEDEEMEMEEGEYYSGEDMLIDEDEVEDEKETKVKVEVVVDADDKGYLADDEE